MAQESSVASSPEAKTDFLASSDQTHLAILPQPPPTASTTMGMKLMPWAWQSVCVLLWLHLKSWYLSVMQLVLISASGGRSNRSPLVTAKSQAAGGPNLHLGM